VPDARSGQTGADPMATARPLSVVSAGTSAGGHAGQPVVDIVRLQLPAVGVYLSVLRSATAGLAARLNFTLEEIEDLRIAVDEACALLLPSTIPGAYLDCEFQLAPDELRVTVSALTLDGAEPARDSFAWTVLSALAGEVDSRVDAQLRVSIDLVKRRTAVVGT
jgi:serine/threonine-protein kinase RsbW